MTFVDSAFIVICRFFPLSRRCRRNRSPVMIDTKPGWVYDETGPNTGTAASRNKVREGRGSRALKEEWVGCTYKGIRNTDLSLFVCGSRLSDVLHTCALICVLVLYLQERCTLICVLSFLFSFLKPGMWKYLNIVLFGVALKRWM